MWLWLCKLLGFKSKPQELPTSIAEEYSVHPYRVSAGSTPPVLMDEVDSVLTEPFEQVRLVFEKPNLRSALAKVRQEALNPALPEALKPAVEAGVNILLPTAFKKALLIKEDLLLLSSTELASILKEKITDDDWNIIKCFIIKRLNDEGIKATNSSTGNYVLVHCKDILDSIKDYK